MNIIEIFEKFPTKDDCIAHLEKVRWNNIPTCPYCQSPKQTTMPKEKRYHCNSCNTSYSVTVGTIFHHTKLPIQKWFVAISLVLNAKKGISARQLSRDLKVNKDTAWSMGMRIRKAMVQQGDLLSGIVEMDETYVGGKPRKGCNNNTPNKRGRGTKKTPVVGMIERGGKVRAEKKKKTELNHKSLSALIRKNIDTDNTILVTDEYKGYMKMSTILEHHTINHQEWYVSGNIHTNTIESFWAILKRGIIGQYHKVSVEYLNKYIDEFCYRFNHRECSDLFGLTLQRALGV
jgi:transposase-like protein